MNVSELIFRNSLGCELIRIELTKREEINLFDEMKANPDLREALSILNPGDTLAIEERWTERD